MSTNFPFDPMTMLKNTYEQTESTFSDAIKEMMNKEAFSEQMGDHLNYYLQYQQLMDKMTHTYLKEMNIPSRDDLANMATLIINLEEKVDQLSDDINNRFDQLERSLVNQSKKEND